MYSRVSLVRNKVRPIAIRPVRQPHVASGLPIPIFSRSFHELEPQLVQPTAQSSSSKFYLPICLSFIIKTRSASHSNRPDLGRCSEKVGARPRSHPACQSTTATSGLHKAQLCLDDTSRFQPNTNSPATQAHIENTRHGHHVHQIVLRRGAFEGVKHMGVRCACSTQFKAPSFGSHISQQQLCPGRLGAVWHLLSLSDCT